MTRLAPQWQTRDPSSDQKSFLPESSGPSLYRQFTSLSTQTASVADDYITPVTEKTFKEFDPTIYTRPFLDFLQDCPTVFHTVKGIGKDLKDAGFTKISEQDAWKLEPSGKYYVERNGSSLIAFVVGKDYEPGNGAAIIAGHIDALTVRCRIIAICCLR